MNVRMTSYADNFEDVMIQRAFSLDFQGFYIDVGAYNPVEHSVTKHFYDRGWRGINVEPNPTPFEMLRSTRDRDINLNIGLSNRAGSMGIFEAPGACWSVDRSLLTGHFGAQESDIVERTIEIKTLAAICERHVPAGVTIDFLKVDVEGHEREVLEGGDWQKWRPRIVVAETNGYETWEKLLLDSGYHFTLFDGINRFYVRDEDKHLIPVMSVPVNVCDQFLIFGYLNRINELHESNLELHESNLKLEAAAADQLAMLNHVATELQTTRDHWSQYGAASLKVARGLGLASKRFPAASRLARKVVHKFSSRA